MIIVAGEDIPGKSFPCLKYDLLGLNIVQISEISCSVVKDEINQ